MTTSLAAPARKLRRAPLYVFIAAWAVPVLIFGQFALLAALPVITLVIATFADARLRSMRWWVGAQALHGTAVLPSLHRLKCEVAACSSSVLTGRKPVSSELGDAVEESG